MSDELAIVPEVGLGGESTLGVRDSTQRLGLVFEQADAEQVLAETAFAPRCERWRGCLALVAWHPAIDTGLSCAAQHHGRQ